MISSSGVDAVLVRAGIIAGRDVDNTIFRFCSSPALPVSDPDRRQQRVKPARPSASREFNCTSCRVYVQSGSISGRRVEFITSGGDQAGDHVSGVGTAQNGGPYDVTADSR
jgi:hypothetical protein